MLPLSQDDPTPMDDLVTLLFTSAATMLSGKPWAAPAVSTTASPSAPHSELSDEGPVSAWAAAVEEGSGVFVMVYTPRYRGMGQSIRRVCAALGLHMASINRSCILSAEQRERGMFHTARCVVASPWRDAVRAFCEGCEPGGVSDDEDWFNGDSAEELDPLASVGTGVFDEV